MTLESGGGSHFRGAKHAMLVLPRLYRAEQPLGPKLATSRICKPGRRGLLPRRAANGPRETLVERNGETSNGHTTILPATCVVFKSKRWALSFLQNRSASFCGACGQTIEG
jgi:hypothetical protein